MNAAQVRIKLDAAKSKVHYLRMRLGEQFVVVTDPKNEPLSIEFHKKDIQIVKEAIRSNFAGSLPMKKLQDDCYRISFDPQLHGSDVIDRLIRSLRHALNRIFYYCYRLFMLGSFQGIFHFRLSFSLVYLYDSDLME